MRLYNMYRGFKIEVGENWITGTKTNGFDKNRVYSSNDAEDLYGQIDRYQLRVTAEFNSLMKRVGAPQCS